MCCKFMFGHNQSKKTHEDFPLDVAFDVAMTLIFHSQWKVNWALLVLICGEKWDNIYLMPL